MTKPEFIRYQQSGRRFGDLAVVLMCRYGDIINFLPAYRELIKGVRNPYWIVHPDFESIFDGVSYVQHLVSNEDSHYPYRIANQTRRKFQRFVVPQVFDLDNTLPHLTECFNKEMWNKVGLLHRWDDLELVFDRRDRTREKTLIDAFIQANGKPTVMLCWSGASNPFKDSEKLVRLVRDNFGEDINLLDVSNLKAHRIYDLIGLMEKCAALISTDTSLIHLAAACSIPVLALVNDAKDPFSCAQPRSNCYDRILHREFEDRKQDVIQFLDYVLTPSQTVCGWAAYYPKELSDLDRISFAEGTKAMVGQGLRLLPLWEDAMPRVFDDKIRHLVYIKDLIDMTCRACGPNDIAVITNADVCFSDQVPWRLKCALYSQDAVYGCRHDFQSITRPLSRQEISEGRDYCGTDLFAFWPEWWKNHRDEMPDMLVGSEGWDGCLREIIRKDGGNHIVKNLCYHQIHGAVWSRPENIMSLPSQVRDTQLAAERGFDRLFPITHIIPGSNSRNEFLNVK